MAPNVFRRVLSTTWQLTTLVLGVVFLGPGVHVERDS